MIHVCDDRISPEYKAYLQSETWKNIRERIKLRDIVCQMCGSTENLTVHHMNSKYRFHEAEHPEQLILLCEKCHTWIHTYWNTCDRIKNFYAEKRHEEQMKKGYY
jgi:5-methylcytosine-specific restriction endonuclease McrA